jgi:hypothetical protein
MPRSAIPCQKFELYFDAKAASILMTTSWSRKASIYR